MTYAFSWNTSTAPTVCGAMYQYFRFTGWPSQATALK
jgi:hypothetical protein